MQQIENVPQKNATPPLSRAGRPSTRESNSRVGGRFVFRLPMRGAGFTEPRSHNASCSGEYLRPAKNVSSAKIVSRKRRYDQASSREARRMLAQACSDAFR